MSPKIRKICLVCPYPFARNGGVQQHVVHMAHWLIEKGFEVKILSTSPGKLNGPMEAHTIRIGHGFAVSTNGSDASSNVSLRPREIPRFLREEGFDIVHLHNVDVGLLWSWRIARNAKKLGIPLFLTWHGTLDASKFAKVIPPAIFRVFYKNLFDGVIAVSNTAMEAAQPFTGPKTTIPNGINLQRFNFAVKATSFPCERKILLFVGRLEKRKGLLELIRSFARLCTKGAWGNPLLVVVGKGPLRKQAEELVAFYRLHNDVRFEGSVSDELLASYYASADVVCAPSLYGESFGIVLLEAWAMGRPVLIGNNSGYRGVVEMLSSNADAFDAQSMLVDPRDFAAVARQLVRLLSDHQYRQAAIAWGFASARDPRFQWDIIAEQTIHFYEEVLEPKGW